MSCESNYQRAPPELNFTLPERSNFAKNELEWSNEKIQEQLPIDILLITANDHEFAACYAQMEKVQRSSHEVGTVDFGKFKDNQNVKVALMKCEQGSKPALIVAKNAAEILRPKAVLAVGICASMEPEKAKLGHVVISAKLASYAHTKRNADGTVEYRDTIANLSKNMGKLILHADDGWEPPLNNPSELEITVHRGHTMLSGPELINNLERRQELKKDFPNALGLEMEGEGLYSAAKDLGIEWAVVKAVSDLADGTKDETKAWQPFSSAMAASLVRHIFRNADVIKNWRHYKNIDSRVGVAGGRSPTQEEMPNTNEDEVDTGHAPDKTSNEDEPASKMCKSCTARKLPDDRNEWPINKIETKYFEDICKLFDLNRSNQSLLAALGCFNQNDASFMIQQFAPRGGIGLAKDALGIWGAKDPKNNNVKSLKEVANTINRADVVDLIEEWEKHPDICHGCALKIKQSNN